MMSRPILWVLALLTVAQAGPLLAEAPLRSIIPSARPETVEPARPGYLVLVRSSKGVVRSLRPMARPAGLRGPARLQTGTVLQPVPVKAGKGRALCGRRSIRGETLSRIPGKLRGCGVKRPVRVSSVAGVALSRPAIMDCQTAKALETWLSKGVKPVVGRLGGGVAGLRVIADYSCRTRNSVPGAKISEHGKGRAIDIAAISLKNGAVLDVLRGWNDATQGKLLRRIHRAACGPFGTVLGPNADRHHRNHFHLDTARYRSGSYCR